MVGAVGVCVTTDVVGGAVALVLDEVVGTLVGAVIVAAGLLVGVVVRVGVELREGDAGADVVDCCGCSGDRDGTETAGGVSVGVGRGSDTEPDAAIEVGTVRDGIAVSDRVRDGRTAPLPVQEQTNRASTAEPASAVAGLEFVRLPRLLTAGMGQESIPTGW